MKTINLLILFFLSSCTHQMQLISRNNTGNGTGTVQEMGKQVTIYLNGKTYKGTYVHDSGSSVATINNSTATAYNAYGSSTAYGTGSIISYIPGSGNGRIIATAGDDTLRCDFQYSRGSGVGYCEDNKGNSYDLIGR